MTLQMPLGRPRPHRLCEWRESHSWEGSSVEHTGSQLPLPRLLTTRADGLLVFVVLSLVLWATQGLDRSFLPCWRLPDGVHHLQPKGFWPVCLSSVIKETFLGWVLRRSGQGWTQLGLMPDQGRY